MPLFLYEAADQSGSKIKDTIEAANEASVKDHLHGLGLVPLSIKASRGAPGRLLSRITQKDIMDFTTELGSLLNSGMAIDKAIYALSSYSRKTTMRDMLREIYMDLQRGQALSQALSRHSAFTPIYVSMIKAGEAGGILESVVGRLVVFLEASDSLREEIKTAIAYPAILTLVTGFAVTFIMMYVVPQFIKMFESTGQQLPLSTRMLIETSTFVGHWWWILLGAAFILSMAARRYMDTQQGRLWFDGLKLRVPLIGPLHIKALTARFTRTLGTLLQSGVPILNAIMVSREVIGNQVVADRLNVLVEGVRKGRGISTPLRESAVFPPIVVQMISVGEEAGKLDNAFITVADRFEVESRRTVKRLMVLLPALLILLMATVVGFIVMSLLLTVFSINDIPF